MADFPAVIDLGDLDLEQGFVIQGHRAGNDAGFSVSSAGDVNGDGLDDLILGAPLAAKRGEPNDIADGRAYVIFGKAGGNADVDLTDLAPSDGLVIKGNDGERAGQNVSSAGDFNGDGFDDVIVGANFGGPPGSFAGMAYILFGRASGFGTVDLSALGDNGIAIRGDSEDDRLGFSVSAAGDVNGDGRDDVILGAPRADGPDRRTGEAYVLFGGSGDSGRINLTRLDPEDGFVIQGDRRNDETGTSVSEAGDVNGDGFDDVIVGAPESRDAGYLGGEAFIVFGGADGFGTIDANGRAVVDLTGLVQRREGFKIVSDFGGDQLGESVSGLGDINGDGFDDLIVGAFAGDDGGPFAGEAYVIFGKAGGFRKIDVTSLAPDAGFIIQGADALDGAGDSVSSAGDVNGDGFDDILVAAPNSQLGGDRAGAVYVVFGSADGFDEIDGTGRRVLDLTTFDPADPDFDPSVGFTIIGENDFDYAGESVSAAGDVNGDGFDDIFIGAPGGDNGGEDAGQAYVIYGRASEDAAGRPGQAISGGDFSGILEDGPSPDRLADFARVFADEGSPATIVDRFSGWRDDDWPELGVIA